MAKKIENWQFPVEGKSEKGGQDYSAFLELVEKEKKSREDINDRIKERLKFLEIEEAKLAMLEDDPTVNAKEVEEQQKLVASINDEIIELSQERSGTEKKADLYLESDKEAREMLERFKSDIEN